MLACFVRVTYDSSIFKLSYDTPTEPILKELNLLKFH